jgi:hypothetical protein
MSSRIQPFDLKGDLPLRQDQLASMDIFRASKSGDVQLVKEQIDKAKQLRLSIADCVDDVVRTACFYNTPNCLDTTRSSPSSYAAAGPRWRRATCSPRVSTGRAHVLLERPQAASSREAAGAHRSVSP